MDIATVQAEGSVTVPQPIREANRIDPGTELLFRQLERGRFECFVLPKRQSLIEVVDRFTVDRAAPSISRLMSGVGDDIAHDLIDIDE
jgi:bifunctional DNA-binding transcriptional regulator/antitoxin component of YhaV-PrlF toxin-antitoxin module